MTLAELQEEKQTVVDNLYKTKTDYSRLRKLLNTAETLEDLNNCSVKKQIYDMKINSFKEEIDVINRCIQELFPEEIKEE